ncbi:MAG TPA: PAS domain S-box protein [Chitinophagaceae bacterium]|nr:PAS domain S-box protein [Chitinophagaceae bacterium]
MKVTPANMLLVSFVLIIIAIVEALSISSGNDGTARYIILGVALALIGFLLYKARSGLSRQQTSEKRFRALLDAAPDATVIVNDKGIIEMVNLQTENIFGYKREELIGQPVEILMPHDLRADHIYHRRDYLRLPKVRSMGVGLELNAVKKDGTTFPVEISLAPMQSDNGLLVSAAIRDITRRKTLENELKRTNAEVEAFTYSVSHDLRAPLRGIVGFTAMLEEDYASKLDDEAKRITNVIKTNALNMGRLIDDLLAFSRMGRKEMVKTKVDMRKIVDEVLRDFVSEAKTPGLQVEVEELSEVSADVGTIRQVWINLISNAIKYSSKKTNPLIQIGSFTKNAQHVFFVKDNGVGFDENYKDKLFKVFQRLHSAEDFEGTGVGLALVDKIIAKHGGEVWATGEVGKGATFYFSLP